MFVWAQGWGPPGTQRPFPPTQLIAGGDTPALGLATIDDLEEVQQDGRIARTTRPGRESSRWGPPLGGPARLRAGTSFAGEAGAVRGQFKRKLHLNEEHISPRLSACWFQAPRPNKLRCRVEIGLQH